MNKNLQITELRQQIVTLVDNLLSAKQRPAYEVSALVAIRVAAQRMERLHQDDIQELSTWAIGKADEASRLRHPDTTGQ